MGRACWLGLDGARRVAVAAGALRLCLGLISPPRAAWGEGQPDLPEAMLPIPQKERR